MAVYNTSPYYKVMKFDVGVYSSTPYFWWAKEDGLLTVDLENVFKENDFSFSKDFNKFDEIELFVRKPLKSEKFLFNNTKNMKIGNALDKEKVKKLILEHKYKYIK